VIWDVDDEQLVKVLERYTADLASHQQSVAGTAGREPSP
jgi:hypothetical protein